MPFANDFTFSRGSGKTRQNAAGLIVGVDFSGTSNTIGTGSKTFTLSATANVNRDWAVNSNVIAVDQAGGGTMTGTVTSYTASTQSLVINVVSVTGSGTSTNWRIGGLDVTKDALTNAVSSEAAATNLLIRSEEFDNAAWVVNQVTVSTNAAVSPDGSTNAESILVTNNTTGTKAIRTSVINFLMSSQSYGFSFFVKQNGQRFIYAGLSQGSAQTVYGFYRIDLQTNTSNFVSSTWTNNAGTIGIVSYPNGWKRITITGTVPASVTGFSARVGILESLTQGVNASWTTAPSASTGVFLWGAQLELETVTSYIPTTTAQVTRNADSFALTASAINLIRQGEGTLYTEVNCDDTGAIQKRTLRLSGAGGDIRLAKRGVGNFNNFSRGALEVDSALFFGTAAGNSQRDNGKEITSFSAVNQRTGLSETIGAASGFAYDGSLQVAHISGTEEMFVSKDLTTLSGKGFGNNTVLGGHWNGSRFIFSCATAGTVFLSSDGLTWRRVNTSVIIGQTNEVTSMMVGGTLRNVIVGDTGFLATSDDNGETWTSRTSGTTSNITGVTSGLGIFVFCRGATATNISTSTDGITWTARTTAVAQNQNDVAFNGTNLFVSVGAAGSIQSSPDGTTWTSRTSGTANTLTGVHFANGLWVAVGASGTIVTSPDGSTWTVRSSGTSQVLQEVTNFGSLFIVVGGAGQVRKSSDGITWTLIPNSSFITFQGVAANGTRFVVSGQTGALYTSDDAITLVSRSNSNAAVADIAFGGTKFVSVGNEQDGSAYVATIDTLGNYLRQPIATAANLASVDYLSGAFYAGSSSAGLWRSVDGDIWTNVLVTASGVTATQFGNGTFVALRGVQGQIATSNNGTTWTSLEPNGASTQNLNSLAFGNNLFVAVGVNGTIITSTTGLAGSYVLRTSGTTQILNSVFYSVRDQLWYAVGNGGTMLFSRDAITWQSLQNAGFVSIENSTIPGTALQSNQILPVFKTGRNRLAVSYIENQVIVSLNGVSMTDTSAVIPSITAGALAENLNGLVYKAVVYPAALSEVELNAITGI